MSDKNLFGSTKILRKVISTWFIHLSDQCQIDFEKVLCTLQSTGDNERLSAMKPVLYIHKLNSGASRIPTKKHVNQEALTTRTCGHFNVDSED